jgi:peptidoglycan/LPS O-acetylase OafA/YrhL
MLRGRNIEDLMSERKNNFDFIRFVAATLVIFSHSYPLTIGNNGSEPFGTVTRGDMTFGELAVSIFFVISGFLITQSFDRSKNVFYYAKARMLRIFPALIVVVLLSIFILGPIFTNLSVRNYFMNPQTANYLKTITLYWVQYNLPGVFLSNTYPGAINGSLWTLWYEFFFYIVVAVLGVTKLLRKEVVIAGFILSTILYHFGRANFYADLFRYFSAGMLVYLFRKQIVHNGWIAFISFMAIALTIRSGHHFSYFFTIFGSYLIFYLSYSQKVKLHHFGKYGDFSYGLYIYAFAVQQTLMALFHNHMSHLENFLLAFPISLMFAFLSWHIVEKNALKLKRVSMINRKESAVKN